MKDLFRLLTILAVILSVVAFAIPPQSHAEEMEAQRVLIRFKPGQKLAVAQTLARQGGQIHYEFDELNMIAVTLPVNAIDRLRNDSNVLMIEEDARRYATDQIIPYGVEHVEARDVWDADRDGQTDPGAPNGSGRLICIIDSGVDGDHEDFAGVHFVGGYPSDWNTDTCGHGTHVAGTIAAMNNAEGVVGVTPGTVSLYILKVFGDNCSWTYLSTLMDAANRCRNAGANIISMSLTGSYYSVSENATFESLYNAGILSIAAAGNGGGTAYGYPASYDSVISVAAVDESNVVAGFSRKNDRVELSAPGVNVYSTFKDGGYTMLSGTSMATPHVSAAAAVAWSTDPTKTNQEIRGVLQQTAHDLGAAGRDNAYGFGLVQTKAACQLLGDAPTSVELARFDAITEGASILVEWDTASELDSLGFNLYRAKSADGPQSRLNSNLIPSQMPGSPVGASYQFVDKSAVPGVTYFYWLEALDLYGAATFHGPVSGNVPPMRRLLPVRHRPAPGAVLRPGQ